MITLRHIFVALATPSWPLATWAAKPRSCEHRLERLGVGPAQQQRHLDAVGRHRGHHRALDVAAAAARHVFGRRDLGPGRRRVEVEEEAAGGQRARAASAAATVWLAVTAETTSIAPARTASACESASVTPCTRACARIGTPAVGAQLHVERRHGVAGGAQILGQDAPDLAVADQRDVHQSMYRSPAAASGSRILYMSRPSTPEASLARFSVSFASRLAAASSVAAAMRARHADDAVVVGHDHVARVHQRARADHRDVDRAERRLDRPLRAHRAAPDREAHLGQRLDVAAAAVDDQRARAARLERRREQLAEEAVAALGRDRGDHDVARPDLLGRHVQHPVVARLQQHGHRRARHLRARVDRAHVGLHQADAPHGLVHGGAAEGAELVGDRGLGALDVAIDDSELVHVTSFLPLLLERRIEARVDAPGVALVDLLPSARRQLRRRLDVALGVVVVVAGLGIDAAHGADHLAGEQDVADRHHLGQQVDARLVVDAGVEEDVAEQVVREQRLLQLLREAPVAAPVVGRGAAAVRDDEAQGREVLEQVALNELHERRGVGVDVVGAGRVEARVAARAHVDHRRDVVFDHPLVDRVPVPVGQAAATSSGRPTDRGSG